MKNMPKILALILALIISLTLAAACSNTPIDSKTDGINITSAENSDIPQIQEITEEKPDLPAETNMGGKNITILTSTYWGYPPNNFVDIAPPEYNGDILNDAAYERKLRIEQEYNMTITHIDIADMKQSTQKLKSSVLANDGLYDIALIRGGIFEELLTSGVLLDLAKMPYLNLEKPWWEKKAYESLAIGKTHYGMDGSMSTNTLLAVDILCFNKDILKDYGMDSPYNLVKSGKWTWDKAVEMAKLVSSDINGDGKMTKDDKWGISYTVNTNVSVLNNSGIKIAELDNDGVPVITLNMGEAVSKIQNILAILFDQSYSFDTLNTGGASLANDALFSDNRALFMFAGTHDIGLLRKMDIDFGIIPYPKYDTAQPEYIPALLGQSVPLICVPKTNDDLENTGIFMEAFAYEGYKSLLPQFYEKVLMGKLARDDESEEMLDYIFNNVVYDVGAILNFADIAGKICWMPKKNLNIASFLEKNLPVVQSAIDKVMATVEDN